MSVLSIAGNLKYGFWVTSSGITSLPNLIKIRPAVLLFNHVDRRIDRRGQPYMRSFGARRANKGFLLIVDNSNVTFCN
jgi:hypothetical protein